jgi:D-alanyl-D-alanine carboxypeptidase/D-alanyl-D-alanine-endopeptidase (penicillin-binding protein 4)
MMLALKALHGTRLKSLMKPFSMRDAKRNVIENHPIKVASKTGTLNFVSGLAGYADLPDGRELVFAIFIADLPRRASLSKEERERPPGASSYNTRAKTLQQALIEHWGTMSEAS